MLYNVSEMSERLGDLRKPNGITKYTLQQLSDEIKEETKVYISPTQLGKYEDNEIEESMNVNNLLALAKFYGVTINFLLGFDEGATHEINDIHEKTGLEPDAIEVLLQKRAVFSNHKASRGQKEYYKRLNIKKELYTLSFLIKKSTIEDTEYVGLHSKFSPTTQLLLGLHDYLFSEYSSELSKYVLNAETGERVESPVPPTIVVDMYSKITHNTHTVPIKLEDLRQIHWGQIYSAIFRLDFYLNDKEGEYNNHVQNKHKGSGKANGKHNPTNQ